ncbi:hypothetical protein CHL76_11750 [Marinococcus halophilus]|uniref:Glutamate synthase large subunit-like protein YerD n=1 Tax=Marinococcus halophilus TaxID=1371 RepID=A0A510Y9M7_MARHA|nr:FMN-binding glutamate synthase family protein [Marinococcus halophilus]OZT79584.1 hypothetical protein CHL76_11750 [Marinococcus halophilus]GEK60059.1 glutamate synthase large subunit-like protein YerD [Marinococcus halophilus]
METTIIVLLGLLIVFIVFVPAGLVLWMYVRDRQQKQHAILKNFPVLGRMRYLIEKTGPEFRQYLFNNDLEGKPFSREQFVSTVKAGKYKTRMLGYGSKENFNTNGYYIVNDMYPTLEEEIRRDRKADAVLSKVYEIDNERLFTRQEHHVEESFDPYLLDEKDTITLGKHSGVKQPFHVKGLIGQSGMSYGSLGDRAIKALSIGNARASGSWMNTGEGGLSEYHLSGGADIIWQIGPGLFGARDQAGNFNPELFRKQAAHEQVKAIEIKLAQGAKQRGGHVDGAKVTEKIASIRNVEPWKTIDSPNRFKGIETTEKLMSFLEELRRLSNKPVGIKITLGSKQHAARLAEELKASAILPDFITLDGSEGGTGASYKEMADSVSLPLFSALPMLEEALNETGLRDKITIVASGKLLTPNKAVTALALGADLIHVARGFMISVGCIMAQVCHTNECPVGVATTDPKRQEALDVEEKSYRVTNFIISMREGMHNLAVAAGLHSPTEFHRAHVIYKDVDGRTYSVEDMEKKY